jgi:DNA mismatch repair protein MutS2
MVRIVHGKGTGALRKAIREQLNHNPLVQSHTTEQRELGGEGVTVVKLAV